MKYSNALGTAGLLLLGSLANAAPIPHKTCTDAPKESIVVLPEPFDAWTEVVCLSGRGHWLVAPKGIMWAKPREVKGKKTPVNIVFSSIGRRTYEGDSKHVGYFKTSKILKDNASDFAYGLWPSTAPRNKQNDKYQVVRNILLVSNTGESYTLFFFVEGDRPEWIVACHDTEANKFCEKSEFGKVTEIPKGIGKITISIAE